MGVINQYYWYRLRAEIGATATHSVITTFAPRDPGYVIDVSGAGVLATSRHKTDALRFVRFLTTKPAQEIIARSDSYEYPVDSGVVTAAPETPFARLRPDPDLAPRARRRRGRGRAAPRGPAPVTPLRQRAQRSVDRFEFDPADLTRLLEVTAWLSAHRDGWLNLLPGVESSADPVEAPGLFSHLRRRPRSRSRCAPGCRPVEPATPSTR